MASGSFYNYPVSNFGVYCEWSSTLGTDGYSTVTLKTYLSYYTIDVASGKWTTSINGESATFTSDAIKVKTASSWTKKLLNTRTLKVKHGSDGTKKVTLSASYPFNGRYSETSIGTITASKTVTLDTIVDCTAPTTVTATPNPFEDTVKIEWSGASGGTGNNISSYQIRYRTKSSSSGSYGGWADLTTLTTTNKSGSKTIDISSKVSKGHYVQFSVRTRGSAGSDFYSAYKESSAIQRKPYTACGEPTSVTASSNNFDTTVTISWSGAKAGTSNSISSYYIQYATSSNNSTWGSWTGLTTVTSTADKGSYSTNMSSKVTRGYYVKFRIRTQGSAGSSYYSGYKESTSIRRNPYTACTAPTTITLSSDVSDSPFETSITIQWSGASGGTNNSISSYLIRYSTSADNSTWSSYADLATVTSTSSSGSKTINVSSKVTRGHYIKVAIRTQGGAGSSYYSSYKYSSSLRRNPYTACGKPTKVTIKSEADMNNVQHTDVFNNKITISWSGASAGENNPIQRYYIQYCTSTNKSSWNSWASLQSSNLTPVGTSSTTVDISSKINRGSYIKFRIRTEGEAGASYVSPYVETTPIRRNSIPTAPTFTKFSSNEYSNDETINVKWSSGKDADDNLLNYELSASVTTNDVWGDWQLIKSEISGITYSLTADNAIRKAIANNQKIKFKIRVQDVFGLYSSYTESDIVTRYDNTGVCICINGQWIPCQIYVGTNDEWIEQSLCAGVSNAWLQCGLK